MLDKMENLSVKCSDWKTGSFPLTGKRLTLANYGRNVLLSVSNNEIIATKVKEPLEPIYPDELHIDGGILKGVDDGEFYFGGVTFFSDSGEEHYILRENFHGFYTVSGKIYVLTGLAHLCSDDTTQFRCSFSIVGMFSSINVIFLLQWKKPPDLSRMAMWWYIL